MMDEAVVKGPGGRQKIHEILVGEIVVEIWLKKGYKKGDKVYFDFTLSQEYPSDSEYKRLGEYVQLRYLNIAMEALLKAQRWVYDNKETYYRSGS